MWHPNKWLVITVHDKSPYIPYRETFRHGADPNGFAWGVDTADAMAADEIEQQEWSAESGRGLQLVRALAAEHCGSLDWARDHDPVTHGKVARVRMLLPNVQWPHTFRDPWSGRTVTGRPRTSLRDNTPADERAWHG
ncbi:hypothetical protein [Streptomyces reniochalinae]